VNWEPSRYMAGSRQEQAVAGAGRQAECVGAGSGGGRWGAVGRVAGSAGRQWQAVQEVWQCMAGSNGRNHKENYHKQRDASRYRTAANRW